MAITDGLITLAEAKLSLGLTVTTFDSDIEDYIEAATPVVEGIAGPLIVRSRVFTFDGGSGAVVLPVAFASVTSIVESGVTITDYVAEASKGIVRAGTSTAAREFVSGNQNVVVTVSVGSATVPANVKLATRELVRFWWQQGRQANRPGVADQDASSSPPMGFLVPKRVLELLRATPDVPGFA